MSIYTSKLKKLLCSAGLTLGLGFSGAAQATVIAMPGTFEASEPIVDFEAFVVGTRGPITVGDMTVSSSNTLDDVNSEGFAQFEDIFEGQYFGFSASTFTIDFAVDVSHVGFGLFDPNLAGTAVLAFNRSGELLESFNPMLGPPGGSFSTYVGFERLEGDIAQVIAVPEGIDLLAVDNIAWRVAETQLAPVPLPASGLLLLAGLGGLGVARRKRQG